MWQSCQTELYLHWIFPSVCWASLQINSTDYHTNTPILYLVYWVGFYWYMFHLCFLNLEEIVYFLCKLFWHVSLIKPKFNIGFIHTHIDKKRLHFLIAFTIEKCNLFFVSACRYFSQYCQVWVHNIASLDGRFFRYQLRFLEFDFLCSTKVFIRLWSKMVLL